EKECGRRRLRAFLVAKNLVRCDFTDRWKGSFGEHTPFLAALSETELPTSSNPEHILLLGVLEELKASLATNHYKTIADLVELTWLRIGWLWPKLDKDYI